MHDKKIVNPLSLDEFLKMYLIELYLVLADHCTLPLIDPAVQQAIDNELELAKVEWHYYVFMHQNKPDQQLCFDLLLRFLNDQLPLLTVTLKDQDKNIFVKNHIDQLLKTTELEKSRFSAEDFDFILSSERYYAEKYFQEHSTSPLGYEMLDIRTSHKAQVMGLITLKDDFDLRFKTLYQVHLKESKKGS